MSFKRKSFNYGKKRKWKQKIKRGGIGPVALAIPAAMKAATMLGLKTAAKAIAATGAALIMKKIANMKRNSKRK